MIGKYLSFSVMLRDSSLYTCRLKNDNRWWFVYCGSLLLNFNTILNRLGRLHPLAIGTNWPSCDDVPLNTNQTNFNKILDEQIVTILCITLNIISTQHAVMRWCIHCYIHRYIPIILKHKILRITGTASLSIYYTSMIGPCVIYYASFAVGRRRGE